MGEGAVLLQSYERLVLWTGEPNRVLEQRLELTFYSFGNSKKFRG